MNDYRYRGSPLNYRGSTVPRLNFFLSYRYHGSGTFLKLPGPTLIIYVYLFTVCSLMSEGP
jgi:hypothetical protein